MLVTTTITTVASLQLIEASNKRTEQCSKVIQDFKPEADVAAKQAYAACVQHLHPVETKDNMLPIVQASVGILLLFMIGAVVKEVHKWGFNRTDWITSIFTGLMVGMLFVIILGMILFVASAFI